MADAVTSQTIFDDGGSVVMHFTNVSDGTGESAVIKVDASALLNGGATTRFAVEAIAWATAGMGIRLLFDATADVLFFTAGADSVTSSGFIDYVNGQGQRVGTGPCRSGIPNNAGAGNTGDILLTTIGHGAGDSYSLTLWLRKTAA